MIVFDLHCEHGHRFEGWFGSSADYVQQLAGALLSCPECSSLVVSKAPMAPSVPIKGNTKDDVQGDSRALAAVPANTVEEPSSGVAPLANRAMPAEVQQALAKLADAQAKALAQSTWVGSNFAKTSREMHYGEREEAPIHGKASKEEAKALIDEGVQIAALPFPVADPEKLN